MNKFIIFLSIVLTLVAGCLIYLVVEPYIKNINQSNTNNNLVGEVHGNIVTSLEENNTNIGNENITKENAVSNGNTPTSNVIGNKLADVFAKMTKEEIDMYNISFTGYSGQSMNGQMVKVLLEAVYTSNANHIGVEGLFVAVTQNYDKDIETTIGEPGNRKNSEDVVKECNDKLDDLKDSTDSEEKFNIECVYDSGIVVEVKITKVK